jgi:beta-galactosidase
MESQFSYPASVPDWNNLDVLHKNILPSRATFYIYDNEADAISRDVSRSKTLCLSGTWKFNLEPYPLEPSPKFYSHGYDTSKWGTIEVPGMWQLQGYGKGPQYTNVIYPWPVDPPNVPLDNNETGYYLRTFKVPANFKGHQLRLRFEGVDSAFHIWVNGNDVGYSQGSRNPSEFDVTEFVDEEKENNLAVRVYQRCDGSYIEDQVRKGVIDQKEDKFDKTKLFTDFCLGSMVAEWDFPRCQSPRVSKSSHQRFQSCDRLGLKIH